MKKKFGWILFFLAAGLVIAAGIRSGMQHDHCHECNSITRLKSELAAWHKPYTYNVW